jgi:hypothetical protein
MANFVDASPYRQLTDYYKRSGDGAETAGLNAWLNMKVLDIEDKSFRAKRQLDMRRARYALVKKLREANKLQQMVEDEGRLLSNNEQMIVANRSLERKEKSNE